MKIVKRNVHVMIVGGLPQRVRYIKTVVFVDLRSTIYRACETINQSSVRLNRGARYQSPVSNPFIILAKIVRVMRLIRVALHNLSR